MIKKSSLEYIIVKIGKFYVVKLEVFNDPEVVQIVMGIFKKRYPDIYVRNKLVDKRVKKEKTNASITQKSTVKQKVEASPEVVQKKNLIKVKKIIVYVEKENETWEMLFWFTFALLIVSLLFLLKYKKELALNKEIQALQTHTPVNNDFADFDFDDIDLEGIDFDDIDEELLRI